MTRFENLGLRGGLWSGILTADSAPRRVFLLRHGEILSFAKLMAVGDGRWDVSVDIPASVLSEGTHSLTLVADEGEGEGAPLPDSIHLDHLSLIAGKILDDDLAAEIALIRSELELIKREFRRFANQA